jgi:hypothetical protein
MVGVPANIRTVYKLEAANVNPVHVVYFLLF